MVPDGRHSRQTRAGCMVRWFINDHELEIEGYMQCHVGLQRGGHSLSSLVLGLFVCRVGGALLERVQGSGARDLIYLIDLIESAGFFPAMISSQTPPHPLVFPAVPGCKYL